MSFFDSLRYRLRILFDPRGHDRELGEEMNFHLDLESMQQTHRADDARTAADAPFAARRKFGNVTFYREESRHTSGLGGIDAVWQDARFALRSFRRAPTFTLVVIATLAIGIGANTAIFSVFDAFLLRPLPYRDASRLVNVSLVGPRRGLAPPPDRMSWSVPKFAVFRATQAVFQDLSLIFASQFTVRIREDAIREDAIREDAIRESGEVVDSHYLPMLGIKPALGRGFLPSEDRLGGPRVALISDGFWRDDFDGDPAVLGRTMDVDGSTFTIVGVLPPGFGGVLGPVSFWIPIAGMPSVWADFNVDPYNHSFFGVGRLADGVSFERAVAMTRELGARVDAAYPNRQAPTDHWSATALPLDRSRVDGGVRRAVFILFGAVGLVLLIACANVANLFLVRATGRQREIAVRLAIGASRWRIVRQLLVESMLLSLLGGAAALIVAWFGTEYLASSDLFSVQGFGGLGDISLQSVRLDRTALAFTAAVAVLTGVMFGLLPALQSTRPSLTSALKDDVGTWHVRLRGITSRNVLTVIELTLAVVLLAGSGLMIRSLRQLVDVKPGFDAHNVLTLRVNRAPVWARDSIDRFFDIALRRLATIPGVKQVAMNDCPPLSGGCGARHEAQIEGRPPQRDGGLEVGVHWITPDWPATMGVPLRRGRPFERADDSHSRKVALVSETAAKRFWPGKDPIGQWISNLGTTPGDTVWVVGVVGDVLYSSLNRPPRPEVYISYFQFPLSYRMMFFLRTDGDPGQIAGAVRSALRDVAPGFPMYETLTMEWRVGAALGTTRVLRTMLYDVAPTDPITYAAIVAVLAVAVVAASFVPARRAAGVPAMSALRTD